jgi:pyrroloquinoline quinone biosynthesis protein D
MEVPRTARASQSKTDCSGFVPPKVEPAETLELLFKMPDLNRDSLHNTDHPRLAKGVRLRTDPISEKPVLLHQETVILLNRTGHQILLKCDGARSLSEIIDELAQQYPNDKTRLARDVSQYVEALGRRGLLKWI